MEKLNSILYAEDNKEAQEHLSHFLKRFCKDLYTANNGKEALEIYKNNKIDLIISDIKMPVMDGIEFVSKIREINSDQALIFTTAYGEVNYLQEAINLQVNAYVLKPIDLDILEKRIETTIFEQKWESIQLEKTKEQESILETTNDGIAITDKTSRFLYVNKSFEELVGYPREELYRMKSVDISKEEDKQRSLDNLNKTYEMGINKNFHKVYINKNGNEIHVSLNSAMMPDNERIIVAVRDITEEKEKQRLLDNYMEMIDEHVVTSTTDLEGRFLFVSKAFCKLSGYSKEELIGKSHMIIRHPEAKDELYAELWKEIRANNIWHGELKNRKKNGDTYWEDAIIKPVYDAKGEKIGYTSIKHDITDKKYIEEISRIDPLTQIYNRRHFDEKFDILIQGRKRENKIFSLVMLDIDFFKQYNDTYGHQAGDAVLKEVAMALKNSLNRASDYSYRLGGEEFAVTFESLEIKKSIEFVNTIKSNIDRLKIEHKKSLISDYLTVSMGLLIIEPTKDIDIDSAYKIADELLYKSKENGRNQITHKVI